MPGAALGRTYNVAMETSDFVLKNPLVEKTGGLYGLDFITGAYKTDAGISFVRLLDWDLRPDANQTSQAVAGAMMKGLSANKEAMLIAVTPPPIMGMSTTGGFEMYIQDRTGGDIQLLDTYAKEIIAKASEQKELTATVCENKDKPKGCCEAKCYLEKDFESISDTIIIEIVPNTYIKDFIIIKTFEIQNGDTINKIDTNGNKQGYWTDGLKCYDNISNIKEMFYKNDLLDSLYIERYHSNSKIEKQFFYKKGQLNGVCKSYFENGQLQSEKLYKDGRLWSVVCVFSENGEKIDFGKIENGIGVLKRYDSEKKLIDETLYKNGLPDGLSKEWYGKYYREYIFDSGNVVLEREFYEDCKTIFIETENANDFRKVKQKKYYKKKKQNRINHNYNLFQPYHKDPLLKIQII